MVVLRTEEVITIFVQTTVEIFRDTFYDLYVPGKGNFIIKNQTS